MSDHLSLPSARIPLGRFSLNPFYPWCSLLLIFHPLTHSLSNINSHLTMMYSELNPVPYWGFSSPIALVLNKICFYHFIYCRALGFLWQWQVPTAETPSLGPSCLFSFAFCPKEGTMKGRGFAVRHLFPWPQTARDQEPQGGVPGPGGQWFWLKIGSSALAALGGPWALAKSPAQAPSRPAHSPGSNDSS